MSDINSIRAELEGREPGYQAPARNTRPRRERGSRSGGGFPPRTKSRSPQASERASILAQDWYERGEQRGFSFPYDVNYLALALQRKIETDPEFKPYLQKGKHDQVERWVAKMVERWWEEYVDGTIHAGNAKDYFLGNDWEDLRYYAHSCLRAAYLREHGRRVPSPLYPQQQAYQDRLKELHRRESVNAYLRRIEEEPEPPEREPVDEEARQRLRSFVEKRRKK